MGVEGLGEHSYRVAKRRQVTDVGVAGAQKSLWDARRTFLQRATDRRQRDLNSTLVIGCSCAAWLSFSIHAMTVRSMKRTARCARVDRESWRELPRAEKRDKEIRVFGEGAQVP
jgi:hypothetical protein